MAEHYFTEEPSSERERQRIDLRLRGHEVAVWTEGGVFSHERVDLGTRVLLREAPELPPAGQLLDLGCGWGPIALAMALDAPDATVWAVDVNARAVALTADNAAALGLTGVRAVSPGDVPTDLELDVIWSNPPIRIGKEALHALLLTWLPRLDPGGRAVLVVGKNLGADSLQRWLGAQGYPTRRVASAKGFRVLESRRG
jgi:16S rRNA (guanine1207-N2)-methyltransferase